jgi:hypothetical protein
MSPQLQQVANTYLTRRALWAVGAFALFAWTFALAAPFHLTDEPIASVPFFGLAAAVIGYALGIHAKWLFCHPRAHLLSRYNRPHLAVLAAILVACCIVYPFVLAETARWSPLGTLACSIAGTAAGIWAMHRPHAITISIAFLFFLSFGTPTTVNSWVLPSPPRATAAAHLAIFVVAWASIAYWLYRLSVVAEEDVDYLIPALAQEGALAQPNRPQSACPKSGAFLPNSWQSRLADAWCDPTSYAPAETIAARKRLVRKGPLAMPLWLGAFGLIAMFLGMLAVAAIISLGFSAGFGLGAQDNLQMVSIITLMTAAVGGGLLESRRARMPEELMLPLSRGDYFNALFRASAQHAIKIWIVTLATIIAYVAFFLPNRMFPVFIAAVIALSLGLHVCMLGAIVNIARNKSSAVRIVAYLVVLFVAAAALIIGAQNLPGRVWTYAESEEIRQRAEQQYVDVYGKFDRYKASNEQRERYYNFLRTVSPHIDEPPAHPDAPWVSAVLLMAAGIAAFLDARRRWLTLELG